MTPILVLDVRGLARGLARSMPAKINMAKIWAPFPGQTTCFIFPEIMWSYKVATKNLQLRHNATQKMEEWPLYRETFPKMTQICQ